MVYVIKGRVLGDSSEGGRRYIQFNRCGNPAITTKTGYGKYSNVVFKELSEASAFLANFTGSKDRRTKQNIIWGIEEYSPKLGYDMTIIKSQAVIRNNKVVSHHSYKEVFSLVPNVTYTKYGTAYKLGRKQVA